jgi:hypothetical protein
MYGPINVKSLNKASKWQMVFNSAFKGLKWKPIRTRIRGRPRKRWIVDIEEDTQIMRIRRWRKGCEERAE